MSYVKLLECTLIMNEIILCPASVTSPGEHLKCQNLQANPGHTAMVQVRIEVIRRYSVLFSISLHP